MVSSRGHTGYRFMYRIAFVVASLYLIAFIVKVLTIQVDKYLARKKRNKNR
jgi:hypothetical protein